MDSTVSRARAAALRAPRPRARLLTRSVELGLRRLREAGLVGALVLSLTSLLLGGAQYAFTFVPLTALVLPMLVGNLVLTPRVLPWVTMLHLLVLVTVTASTGGFYDARRVGGVIVVFTGGLVSIVLALHRAPLGLGGFRGESMLVDLRDRIARTARMPALPDGWYADMVLRSAGGSSFAGDFVVAARSCHEGLLNVVMVDVSGKGEQAGSRSLLLSGAFGGLLGALQPPEFLPAANDYLLRQDWSEGFATAVHLSVDLHTGAFELRSAGHPPAVQLLSGSGRWVVHEPEGPVLGLLPDADFSTVRGSVGHGDALLLFTDGLVETSRRDIALGIDSLVGHADRLLQSGFDDAAKKLVDQVHSSDDRALLLLHRHL